MMYDWMEYLNHTQSFHIQHKLNTGKEKKIGPYPVDGYDPETKTVYQLQGCFWHGHQCWLTKNVKDQKWHKGRQARYDKTIKTGTLIRAQGYRLVEQWECHFRNDMRRNHHLKSFCDARKPPTPQRSVTETEILQGVTSGQFFRDGGMRHPCSGRMAVVFLTSDDDTVSILSGNVAPVLHHRRSL